MKPDKSFYEIMKERKSCRHFSTEAIQIESVIECIKAAGTSPSGANTQPWLFALVTDKRIKSEIRAAAEREELDFYQKKAPEDFLKALEPFKTSWQKPHLEEAPALIVIFSKSFNEDQNEKQKCYYPRESTGIATGMLITALHLAGFATLTHTPSPMNFLNEILERPFSERPYLILAVGKQCKKVAVLPEVKKKPLDEIMKIYGS